MIFYWCAKKNFSSPRNFFTQWENDVFLEKVTFFCHLTVARKDPKKNSIFSERQNLWMNLLSYVRSLETTAICFSQLQILPYRQNSPIRGQRIHLSFDSTFQLNYKNEDNFDPVWVVYRKQNSFFVKLHKKVKKHAIVYHVTTRFSWPIRLRKQSEKCVFVKLWVGIFWRKK